MTRIERKTLLTLVAGDEELLRLMCESGLVPDDEASLAPEHLETARVVHTLVHELEVNWPGVEVIVRLRSELTATRRQVADLLDLWRKRGG